MRLRGPIRKVFGFSEKDRSKPGTFISAPMVNGVAPFEINCGKYQVEFIHQTHVNMCGDACVNMVLKYRGKAAGSQQKNPRGIFEGINTDDVKDKLRAGGLQPVTITTDEGARAYSADRLGLKLKQYGPLICARSMHFVLLTGIDGDRLFIHDPWRGPNIVQTLEDFNRSLQWGDPDRVIGCF